MKQPFRMVVERIGARIYDVLETPVQVQVAIESGCQFGEVHRVIGRG